MARQLNLTSDDTRHPDFPYYLTPQKKLVMEIENQKQLNNNHFDYFTFSIILEVNVIWTILFWSAFGTIISDSVDNGHGQDFYGIPVGKAQEKYLLYLLMILSCGSQIRLSFQMMLRENRTSPRAL